MFAGRPRSVSSLASACAVNPGGLMWRQSSARCVSMWPIQLSGHMSLLLRTSCISAVVILSTLFGIDYARANFLAITVATEHTDGFERFMRSARTFDVPVEVLGMGQEWRGGDVTQHPGGGQKIRLLREALEKYKTKAELIVMFTDSYDVVFLNSTEEMVRRFVRSGAQVLFSAEHFCWPDRSLAPRYPPVGRNEKRFLNSGGFIGYAPALYRLVTREVVADDADDQLYYTRLFLDAETRRELGLQLDTESEIFLTLNGALAEVSVDFKDGLGFLQSVTSGAVPLVAHGNGPVKAEFNSLTNYLGRGWNPVDGCQQCPRAALPRAELPHLHLAVFLESPTPFLAEFFERLAALSYPKERMRVAVHVLPDGHMAQVEAFRARHARDYRSFRVLRAEDFADDHDARNALLAACQAEPDCELFVALDSVVQLTEPATLERLVEANRSVVAPLVARPRKLWSNFWGALSDDGFYARSDDYVDIVERRRTGLWNVPYVTNVFAVRRRQIPRLAGAFEDAKGSDADVAFAAAARHRGVFLFLLNTRAFGHLVDADGFPTHHLNNDLWAIFSNPADWEAKYLHPDYARNVDPERDLADFEQPCPDVFWVPLLSDTFCRHLIGDMEHFGEWSNGKNEDPRLEGGYENVPTRDIHMRQVDWEEHWMEVLRKYVYPIQKKLFQGYEDEPSARMNFVVRYKPTEQASLRPHHDASSYTLNIALNRHNVDYQGGGARFVRYNCSVIDTRVGWAMVHPGRVTHLHEGLTTTNGTRYIFITFVNP